MMDVQADVCLTTLAAGSCNSCLIWPSGSVMGPNICSAPPLALWWRNGWWKYKRTQVDTLIQSGMSANSVPMWKWCDVFLFLKRPEWAFIVECTSWSRLPHFLVSYDVLRTSSSWFKASNPCNNAIIFHLPESPPSAPVAVVLPNATAPPNMTSPPRSPGAKRAPPNPKRWLSSPERSLTCHRVI